MENKNSELWEGLVMLIPLALIVSVFIISVFNSEYKDSVPEKSYTDQTVETLNNLKSPVVLVAKSKSDLVTAMYSVTLKDANDSIVYFGNLSGLANSIGASKQIGDTIK